MLTFFFISKYMETDKFYFCLLFYSDFSYSFSLITNVGILLSEYSRVNILNLHTQTFFFTESKSIPRNKNTCRIECFPFSYLLQKELTDFLIYIFCVCVRALLCMWRPENNCGVPGIKFMLSYLAAKAFTCQTILSFQYNVEFCTMQTRIECHLQL